METASTLFLGTTVTAYSLSAWLYRRACAMPSARSGRWAYHLLVIGIIVHTVLFLGRWSLSGAPPLVGLPSALLVYGWLLVVSYLAIQGLERLPQLASWVLALAALPLGLAMLMLQEPRPLPDILRSIWLPVHVGSAFLSYALFSVAALLSIVFLLQEQALRRPGPSRLWTRLPPLAVAERHAFRCAIAGYMGITLALGSGALWAAQAWGEPWSWDPKQVMALVTWLVYGFYLRVRPRPSWAGRRAAWILVGGFACVLVTFVGVSLIGITQHQFGAR